MMPWKQLGKKVASRSRPCLQTANAHTLRRSTSSLAVPMLTTTTNWNSLSHPLFLFFMPSPSHAQHPSSLVPYCLHLPHGGLHIWGFRDNRFAVDVQAMERIVLVSTMCSFSTGAVGPPKRFQPHRAHQQRCQEWIGRRWIIWSEDLVAQRGWLALGNEEGQKNFPRERWKWCLQELCASSHPFSSITPLTYIVQLEWLTSTSWPNSSLSSFSTPSSAICDKTLTMSIILVSTNSRNR